MRKPYLPAVAPHPVLTRRGSFFHDRSVIAVHLTGPHRDRAYEGMLDTGSDETIFKETVAVHLGIDLTGAPEREIDLVGRPAPMTCRYASVQLRITDGLRETYEWTAMVGFAPTRLRYNLLGQGGFLEFFDADFRGADREVVLIPNRSFPGTQVAMPPRP
jgi:hypothetical protein